jgi:hypothetical protein
MTHHHTMPMSDETKTASMPAAPRSKMNGKPVFEVQAKSVLNWASGFGHKLLCSEPGLTFTCAGYFNALARTRTCW